MKALNQKQVKQVAGGYDVRTQEELAAERMRKELAEKAAQEAQTLMR